MHPQLLVCKVLVTSILQFLSHLICYLWLNLLHVDGLYFTVDHALQPMLFWIQVAGLVGRADVLASVFFLGAFLSYRRMVLSSKLQGRPFSLH